MVSEESPTQPQPQQLYRDLELEGKISQIQDRSIIFSLVIFSFLVLLALCFIYTMYLCTHRWHNSIMDQPMGLTAANQVAALEASVIGPQHGLGLDPPSIDSLPIVSFGAANMTNDIDCSICLTNFQNGHKLKLVPQCCHAFHSDCLDKWLVARSNCPLCRAQVRCLSF